MTQTHTLILFTWTLLQALGACDTADTCVRPIDNAENIRSLQAAVKDLTSQFRDLTSKVTTQQQDLENLETNVTTQQRETEAQLTTFNTDLGNLKSDVGPKVAFSASLADSSWVWLGPAASQTIVFNNVFFNNGNAYNPATGYFTASHKGAYLFTFTTQSGSTSYLSGAQLMKNGETQVSTWETKGPEATLSGAVILSLNDGDTVNVITWGSGYQVLDNNSHFTTFSGFLLFPL